MGRELQRCALEPAQRAHHQVGAEARQHVVKLARGHVGADRHPLGHGDRAGIEGLFHAHDRDARLRVSGHDGAVDRRSAAPARQQRCMQIEAAERHRLQDRLGQEQAVGDHDGGVGRMGANTFGRFRRPQRLWRENRKAQPPRLAFDRTRLLLHAAAGGPRRRRIDRGNLVSAPDDLDQRGNGEFRRAHEDQAHRSNVPARSYSAEAAAANGLIRSSPSPTKPSTSPVASAA